MKIKVEKLGAIKEASINLDKSFLLFCGQNNTGKTYLSFIIYALSKFKLSRDKALRVDISRLIEDGFFELDVDTDAVFTFKENSLRDLKKNLDTVFGISEEQAENLFKNFDINYITDQTDCQEKIKNISFGDTFGMNDLQFNIIKEVNELKVRIELLEGEDYSVLLKDPSIFQMMLSSAVVNRLAFHPIRNSVIFPVERNSIYTFSKELSINRNLLIDQMQKLSKGDNLDPFDLISSSSNRYPLAIKDGLQVSDDLQNIQKRKSEVYDLAIHLENSLLNGTLSVDKDGDLLFTSNKSKSKKLPIHMSASIVKTLSSLIFYLKYQARKGDLIIIDEPEMNLHPDSQILLARVFAKLHQIGFRFIISTHSDYIIREINNLIMCASASETDTNVAQEIGYDTDMGVKHENVACYYFHYQNSNSRNIKVKELTVGIDGVEIESIDNEINAQNERMQELFYALSEED